MTDKQTGGAAMSDIGERIGLAIVLLCLAAIIGITLWSLWDARESTRRAWDEYHQRQKAGAR